jgi:hypothetical protein
MFWVYQEARLLRALSMTEPTLSRSFHPRPRSVAVSNRDFPHPRGGSARYFYLFGGVQSVQNMTRIAHGALFFGTTAGCWGLVPLHRCGGPR